MEEQTAEMESHTRPEHAARVLGWASLVLLAVGLAPRLAHFLCGRALWLDETQLAASLYERGFLGLLSPLEFSQVAPPLYLWSQKAAMHALGATVYAVRLPAFVGSVVALLLFWKLVRRFLSPLAACFALFFFAVSQHLIYYAAECKPYATDACIFLILIAMLLWWEANPLSLWRTAACALLSAACVAYSLSAVFVLGGAGGVMLFCFLWRRDLRRVLHLAIVCASAALLFGAIYALLWRAVQDNQHTVDYMQHYWRHGFMPFPPKNFFQLRWFRERAFIFFEMPGGFTLTGLALFTFLAGALSLAWRAPKLLALLLAPLLLTLLASGLRLYPFHGRMTLFLAPMLFLLVGEGCAALVAHPPRKYCLIGLILLALLGAQPLVRAARMTLAPTRHHELEAALERADAQWAAGDRVYLRHIDYVGYRFLKHRYTFSETAVLTESRDQRRGEAFEARFRECLPQLAKANRVWIPLAYDSENMIAPFIAFINQFGQGRRVFLGRGASLYCYTFNDPAGEGAEHGGSS